MIANVTPPVTTASNVSKTQDIRRGNGTASSATFVVRSPNTGACFEACSSRMKSSAFCHHERFAARSNELISSYVLRYIVESTFPALASCVRDT